MVEIRKTEIYVQWLDGLRDIRARARIQVRIERLAAGNAGDVRPVGEGVSELRIDSGPGYRVYFTKRTVTWSYYWPAVIKVRKLSIFARLCALHAIFKDRLDEKNHHHSL